MEVELARAKLDLMSLDSQLKEAIQQKIELSQQLEQWQVSNHGNTVTMVTQWQVSAGYTITMVTQRQVSAG